MVTCSWVQRRMSKGSERRTESVASSQAYGELEKRGTGWSFLVWEVSFVRQMRPGGDSTWTS